MKNPFSRVSVWLHKKEKKEETVPPRDWTVFLIPGSIIIAGIFIASAVLVSGGVRTTGGTGTGEAKVAPVTEKDHVLGSRDAQVFLIEYSDFRCGFCGRFHTTIQQLLQEYEGKVAWVYRHTPYQAGAHEASVASECVAKLGGEDAFWKFANNAFENQGALGEDWYVDTARSFGLDAQAFSTCQSSGEFDALFEEQTKNAQALGGQGTPFSVLLTKKGESIVFSGALPIEKVRALIDQALKK